MIFSSLIVVGGIELDSPDALSPYLYSKDDDDTALPVREAAGEVESLCIHSDVGRNSLQTDKEPGPSCISGSLTRHYKMHSVKTSTVPLLYRDIVETFARESASRLIQEGTGADLNAMAEEVHHLWDTAHTQST